MTFLFQSLDRTAVSGVGGIKKRAVALRPTESDHHVPVSTETVAGKLRECQALGPRLTMLENQIQRAQENQEFKRRQTQNQRLTEKLAKPKKIDPARESRITQVKQDELRIKQASVLKTKREHELAQLQHELNLQHKFDNVAQDKDQFKSLMEDKKEEKQQAKFDRQQVCRKFHQDQMQKLADIKAIKDYQSAQIAKERQQQKEYELMLQKELDEELKNMKQREIDLKNKLLYDFGGEEVKSPKRAAKKQPVQQKLVIEGARKQKRSQEVLKNQMVQQRLKVVTE